MTKESKDLQVTKLHLKDYFMNGSFVFEIWPNLLIFWKRNLNIGYQRTHVCIVRPATSLSVGSSGPNN